MTGLQDLTLDVHQNFSSNIICYHASGMLYQTFFLGNGYHSKLARLSTPDTSTLV